MSSSFTGIYFTVLILIFEVTPQPEFDFTCPSVWTDGAVENMKCVIPLGKFSATPSGLCDTYVDSVVFRLTTADGAKSAACTVTGIDATCDGSTNNGGCGCREKSGGNVTIDYNITAVKADYEGAHWECEPQCYDANGIPPVLSPPNTTECFNTKFAASTTTTPNTTSASPTSPTSPTSPGQESDLIWLLLLLLLLIPLLILIIIFCCPCGNIACHWCCCTGRCYCRCADKAGTGGGGSAWCKKEDSFISHVCYLCGYKKVKEEKGFICCSLEKCEVVPTTSSSQNQQTTNGNRTVDGRGSTQNQETTYGNITADGKGSGQRDNKVGTGHVATNGARNGEKVSKPVQETELTKVQETSSAPSGVKETSLNGAS